MALLASCVKRYIELGAPIDGVQGHTPLVLAAQNNSYDAMKVLLESGADPSIKNFRNQTPLAICLLSNHQGCAKLLQTFKSSSSSTPAAGEWKNISAEEMIKEITQLRAENASLRRELALLRDTK